MSLIIRCDTIGCSNSITSHSTRVDTKAAGSISITSISNGGMVDIFKMLLSMMLLGIKIIYPLLPSITLSDILHEVSIIHSISHLSIVIMTAFIGTL